ncbi:MAG: hypothetical protein ACREHF_14720 [Rhizomicrobium sp.]
MAVRLDREIQGREMHFPSLGEKKDIAGYDGGPLGNADFIAGLERIHSPRERGRNARIRRGCTAESDRAPDSLNFAQFGG